MGNEDDEKHKKEEENPRFHIDKRPPWIRDNEILKAYELIKPVGFQIRECETYNKTLSDEIDCLKRLRKNYNLILSNIVSKIKTECNKERSQDLYDPQNILIAKYLFTMQVAIADLKEVEENLIKKVEKYKIQNMNKETPKIKSRQKLNGSERWLLYENQFKNLLYGLSVPGNSFIERSNEKTIKDMYKEFTGFHGIIKNKINWISSWASYKFFYIVLRNYNCIKSERYNPFFRKYFLFHEREAKESQIKKGVQKNKSFGNDGKEKLKNIVKAAISLNK